MDYNSFLTRDFKSQLNHRRIKKRFQFTRLHLVAIIATLLALGTLLTFISHDAKATRNSDAPDDENKTNRIVLPLAIPSYVPAEGKTANTPTPGNWLEVTVKPGDSLAGIFVRNDMSSRDLHDIMALGKPTAILKTLTPGQTFKFHLDEQNQTLELIYKINKFETLAINRHPSGFKVNLQQATLDKRIRHATGKIETSLFEAGQAANMSDALTMEMANIFGWDIDFALDLRSGDHFTLLYEEHFLNGKKVREGPILAAEFVTQKRRFRAVRYTDERGHSHYYTPEGLSMRKTFLRTPVDFRRISSRFGKRRHPVLNRMRLHKGVDYAAPRGTPIKASGDGKVIFRGRKGAYGRAVIIQHGGRYSTLYAHLSSYKRGVYSGKRVRQGQIIGYVGSSGRVTGSHLHYEFRVNGVHRNPLTIKLPKAAPIKKKYKEDFSYHAENILAQLDMYTPTRVALNTN